MKKVVVLSLITFAAFACHRKTAPQVTPAEPASVEAPPPPPPPPAPPTATEAMKAGAVIYTNQCTRCHGAKPVDSYTADQWTRILKSMIPKARLTDAQAQQVTAYVMANAKK